MLARNFDTTSSHFHPQEYQSLRKQLLAHHRLLRQQKSAAAAAAKKLKFSFTTYSSSFSSQKEKDKEKEKEKEQQSQEDLLKPLDPDPALSSLPQSLCQGVARGLVHYIIVLTTAESWDFLPVACKVCTCTILHVHVCTCICVYYMYMYVYISLTTLSILVMMMNQATKQGDRRRGVAPPILRKKRQTSVSDSKVTSDVHIHTPHSLSLRWWL